MGKCGAACALVLMSGPVAAACAPDEVDLRWPGGAARFTVDIADTAALRETGLMNREKLAGSAGMLFVYQTPEHAFYWMKNTLIPLDIVFADQAGHVTRVASNAIPGDLTPIDGGDGVTYVLEINGGLAARMGIGAGAELRAAAMVQDALSWPCAAN